MDQAFGDFRLDSRRRLLTGPAGTVELGSRSFDILKALLARPGEIITKDDLFGAVWPGVAVEENTLQVHMSSLRKALPSDMIVTVHGRGYKYAGPLPQGGAAAGNPQAARKPVVAVLPFDNLSGDPGQQFFADGMTGAIIDRLSRFHIITVVGWHSSFALRDSPNAVSDARDKLNAEYLLSGSAIRADGRLRIAARLSATATGATLWADHYDRPMAEIFEIQDDVAALIASTLVGRVELATATAPRLSSEASLSSYELVLKGIWHYKKLTRASMTTARQFFEQAISIYPGNAEAYRFLGICHMTRRWNDFEPDGPAVGVQFAARGVELDPASSSCYQALTTCLLWSGDRDGAWRSNLRSRELNAGYPDALLDAGCVVTYDGDPVGARQFIAEAFRLNPLPPVWYPEYRALTYFLEEHYAEALPAYEAIPACAYDNLYALSCLGHLGWRDKALALRSRLAQEQRNWDFERGIDGEPWADSSVRERLRKGLQKALAF